MSYHVCPKCIKRPERETDPTKPEVVPVFRRADLSCRVRKIQCVIDEGKATVKVVR